mmetsp:Transcript_62522/g.182799  ORF Transcript_62522/g.182799 Transcript_62522/m.182799 type:complete len:249 (+) Transcript_62522:6-752(+)
MLPVQVGRPTPWGTASYEDLLRFCGGSSGEARGSAAAIAAPIAARSALPPQRTTATLRRSGYFSLKAAETATATPTPAEGSMASFMRSHTARVADAMAASSTRKMSSTRSRTMGKVLLPRMVFRPSAMVRTGPSWSNILPASLLRKASPALAGSAAMTRQDGSSAFTAVAMPPIMPPPPMGTMTASRLEPDQCARACLTSSKAMVPWPLITSRSFDGCTRTAPSSSTTLAAMASLAALDGSQSTILAP